MPGEFIESRSLSRGIQAVSAEERELMKIWELIEEKKAKAEREAQERKAEREAQERKAEREAEEKRREAELVMKRVELKMNRVEIEQKAGKRVSDAGSVKPFKIKDLMQPFKVGEDVGLFLVNFERTCDRINWSLDTWSELLLTPLPCEGAQVVARLIAEEPADYDVVNLALQ